MVMLWLLVLFFIWFFLKPEKKEEKKERKEKFPYKTFKKIEKKKFLSHFKSRNNEWLPDNKYKIHKDKTLLDTVLEKTMYNRGIVYPEAAFAKQQTHIPYVYTIPGELTDHYNSILYTNKYFHTFKHETAQEAFDKMVQYKRK